MKHKKLPTDTPGKTNAVKIGKKSIYITTMEYDDGTLGGMLIKIGKEGTQLRVYDVVAILISLCLQHGVPLRTIVDKLKYQNMQPNGVTDNNEIPMCKSIPDYIGRWLEAKYLKGDEE